ncbi:malonate decarboxylase acyl carrier protein [Paenibacillus sp. FSL R5-0527]|uniref:malonate decarboxylase acyl carrier protein n=1 Tax=Paenibacillus TaxID=44249 RepID=UPI00097AF5C9|nr:malonate decarboxylase acyl carrier protein [Paenibacillus macerans]OMG51291.1 malonate decarboxylase acyl carrier protein [Paenibacillus macerans]
MERLEFQYQTSKPIQKPAHIGVVGSGDLEIIVEPVEGQTSNVSILTGSDGFGQVWQNVLTRFFNRYPITANFTVHDFGATPGVVMLRFTQVLEVLDYAE